MGKIITRGKNPCCITHAQHVCTRIHRAYSVNPYYWTKNRTMSKMKEYNIYTRFI